jgi:hypothetical protein
MVLKTNLIAFRVDRAMASKIVLVEVGVGVAVMVFSFVFGTFSCTLQRLEL